MSRVVANVHEPPVVSAALLAILTKLAESQQALHDRFDTLEGKEKRRWTHVPIVTMQAGMAAALDPRLPQ